MPSRSPISAAQAAAPFKQAATSAVGSSSAFQKHASPVRAFAAATASCSSSSQAYGECMLARYQDVERGMCEREFLAFKACVQTAMGRKW